MHTSNRMSLLDGEKGSQLPLQNNTSDLDTALEAKTEVFERFIQGCNVVVVSNHGGSPALNEVSTQQ